MLRKFLWNRYDSLILCCSQRSIKSIPKDSNTVQLFEHPPHAIRSRNISMKKLKGTTSRAFQFFHSDVSSSSVPSDQVTGERYGSFLDGLIRYYSTSIFASFCVHDLLTLGGTFGISWPFRKREEMVTSGRVICIVMATLSIRLSHQYGIVTKEIPREEHVTAFVASRSPIRS